MDMMEVQDTLLPPKVIRNRKKGLSWNDVSLRRHNRDGSGSNRSVPRSLISPASHTTIGFDTSGKPDDFSTRDAKTRKGKGSSLKSESTGSLFKNDSGYPKRRPHTAHCTRNINPEAEKLALCQAYYSSPTDRNHDLDKILAKYSAEHRNKSASHYRGSQPRNGLQDRSQSVPNSTFHGRYSLVPNSVTQNRSHSLFDKRPSIHPRHEAPNLSRAWNILKKKSIGRSSYIGTVVEQIQHKKDAEDIQSHHKKALICARMKRIFKLVVIVLRWFLNSRAMRDERVFLEQMREIDPVNITTKAADSRDEGARQSTDDATFFFDDFKANRQMRMPIEARRTLTKPPRERNDQEVYHAMIALRSIKQIADFPVRMQRVLAQNGYYESYEPKRIIVREKHRACAFYFILYGSVLVAVYDQVTNSCKTACRMYRGESFGELAIIHRTPRQSTVISNTEVELLRISTEVYERLFMCGGKRDLKDPDHYDFISQQIFLKGWPMHLLEDDDPEKINFAYFKRGAILVRDSNYSDWIYVVKSGSLQVLKKLVNRKPTVDMRRGQLVQQKLITERDKKLAFQCDQFNVMVDRYKLTFPDPITVRDTVDTPEDVIEEIIPQSEDEFGSDQEYYEEEVEIKESRSASRASDEGNLTRVIDTVKRAQTALAGLRDQSTPNSNIGRPIRSAGAREAQRSGKGRKRTFIEDLNQAFHSRNHEVTSADKDPVFVHIQTLVKGQVFGLATIAFDEQPSFILISNGAECLAINKKFYLEHSPPSLLRKLKTQVSPFPSEEKLQEDLMTRINWDAYREALLHQIHTHHTARQKPSTKHL